MEPVTSTADVEPTIRRLLAVQFGEDEEAVRPDTRLEADLGADSLAVAELLAGVEDAFGIQLPESDPELGGLVTVADLVRLVRGRVSR
ncbi:MAG TPA: acyl carrier protein [Thermoleophilaceae bacterium]|jgi:acyl carrier protein